MSALRPLGPLTLGLVPPASSPVARRRARRLRAVITPGAALASVSAVLPVAPVAASAGGERGVGTMMLQPCHLHAGRPTYCGVLPVPFDREDPAAGTIEIGFAWIPAHSDRVSPTLVAEEGGPGLSATDSAGTYVTGFGSILHDHDLLLVDDRGTGRSEPITCGPIQQYSRPQPTRAFIKLVGACGDQLNHQRRRPDGSFVHASDLYGTANVARDLADVLTALGTGRVDLYGSSYGTWASQTFASRYPQMLRSLTLDGTYEVLGLSPWYISSVVGDRFASEATCARSLACPHGSSGAVWGRIGALAAQLRRAPLTGTTTDDAGKPISARVDIRALVNLVNDGAGDNEVYVELDAAVRAWLDHADGAPLLRLAVRAQLADNGSHSAATSDSAGEYFAVSCTDYPSLFNRYHGPHRRASELRRQVRHLAKGTFAPFTTNEWLQLDAYMEPFNACLSWPRPVHHDPPIIAAPPLLPPSVPALVMNSDLDTITPIPAGVVVAGQLGPSARHISFSNLGHVSVFSDSTPCAGAVLARFIAHPEQVNAIDALCAATLPELHLVGSYPRTFADANPAQLRSGAVSADCLRVVSVAAGAAGDVLGQSSIASSARDGLRGGGYAPQGKYAYTLNHMRFVTDASVSGALTTSSDSGVSARLTVERAGQAAVRLDLAWDSVASHALLTATGTCGGSSFSATAPAP